MTGQVPYADKTDMAVVMDIMIHKRLPDWDDDLIGSRGKILFRKLLNKCWSRERSARPLAADAEIQGERISFEEFCELDISGYMRQIHIYTPGPIDSEITGDKILIEAEIIDPFMGLHRPWIQLQIGDSGSVGESDDCIQLVPSLEASEVGDRVIAGEPIGSKFEHVDITHLQRLVRLWGNYPEAPKVSS
ncbi:hypothetical protein FRC12_009213 [Ceratobasidium sp. 428]|nr:hypothetical protein FRC12_009213 [Ceratobasidium sp. 428]